MSMKYDLLWLAIVTALPITSLYAQDDFGFDDEAEPAAASSINYIEIGMGGVSDDNGKLGEFSDNLDDEGALVIGGIHLETSTDTSVTYLDLSQTPYNKNGSIGYWRPGDLKAEIYGYDSQKIEKFNVLTKYADSGNATDLAIRDNEPGRRTYRVERDTYGIAVTKFLGKYWSLSADYNRQKKEGAKTLGDHESSDAILPSVIDYEHDRFTIGAHYRGEKLVVGTSYYLSAFTNDNDEIRLFDNGVLLGELGLEPDNKFSRFELDGVYRIGGRTSLNWIVNWSKAEQDETIIGEDSLLLPGSNIDGEVERLNGRITLSSRPIKNFNYKLEYAYRDRKANHDPIDLNYRRDSKVFDKEQDTYKAEGGYRFANRSRLRFGYERDEIRRTSDTTLDYGGINNMRTVDDTEEDTFWVSYQFAPIGNLYLSVKAETSDRDGDQTQWPEWISPYNANRDREKYTLNASYMLNDRVTVSGRVSSTEDDYDIGDYFIIEGDTERDPYGMKSRDWYSAYVDVTFTPRKDMSLSIYVMNSTFSWKRFGWENDGGINHFQYDSKDDTDAIGLTLNWQVRSKLQIDASCIITDSNSQLKSEHFDGADAGTIFYQPDYSDDTLRLDIQARYQLNADWSGYIRLIYEDWDIDDPLANGDYHNDLGYGWDADDGGNHAFIIGVRKRF